MKVNFLGLLLSAAALASAVKNRHGNYAKHMKLGMPSQHVQHKLRVGNSTFTQPIDHSNPSLGTFEQTYYWSTEFWGGPGSPVVLLCPGEVAAANYKGYLDNGTISGAIAYEANAATIVIEHRYWGQSSPYEDLTTANLQYLTLENAILDLVNFANNVQLPFVQGNISSNADAVPWTLVGGSYAGALTAWTEMLAPGTFWAYLASSAVVQSISDFWTYFEPIQQGMPRNCSSDVSLVIEYMDNILLNGTAQQKHNLKAKFNLQDLEHDDDFMAALMYGPETWQTTQVNGNGAFFEWCDFVENADNVTNVAILPGPEGVGLDKALSGYAKWWNTEYGPCMCGVCGDVSCLDTYNASNPTYTDYSVASGGRQWDWMLCNAPFAWWLDGAPTSQPTIVSRLLTPDYWARQCDLHFPTGPKGETYSLNKKKTAQDTNAFTCGWDDRNSTRLTWTNGQFDPWRSATVSAQYRPGGPLASTASAPVNVIPGGVHCYDLILDNGMADPGTQQVIDTEISQVVTWINEFSR